MIVAALALLAQAPMSLEGSWINDRSSVVVKIRSCRNGLQAMCGTIQSASDKAQADARRAGTNELVGTEVLHEFVAIGLNSWSGTLFVPDLNRRSKARVILLDDNRLRVRGCAVGNLFCKSQIWSRIPE